MATQATAAAPAPAASKMRKTRDREQDNYTKYLKYPSAGFNITGGDKTYVWYPTKDAEKAYVQVPVVKESEKEFTVQMEDVTQKTLPKNEKTYMGVNGAKFDGVEDMGELGHLNEPAVLYNLKKRYEKDLFHTYSGLFLVVVNPYKRLPIYGNDIIDMYRGKNREKVAPHIFAMSDVAYRAMLQEDRNQSMLITGESGAGKTENTKKVIQYLTRIAGRSAGESLLEEQLLEFNPILEALGNAKTKKNNNSSRFGKFIELQFNSGGQIAGAHTRIYLLEKSRVVFQASMERNFHVFYQIMNLEPDMKKRLFLTKAEDFSFISRKGANGELEPLTVEGIDDRADFELTRKALGTLKIETENQDMIWQTLAAILHLGNLPFTEISKDVAGLADEKVLSIVATLLGVDTAKLRQCILSPSLAALAERGEKTFKQLSKPKAERSRDALCKALYGNLFLWVVKQINEELSHSDQQSHFIGVLDISGFEIFEVNSFEQICINYTNEKLQQFFNHHMFNLEQEEYKREGLTDWKFEDYGMDLQDTIDLIEKEGYGILSILEDQCLIPEADDKSFTVKLHSTHSAHRNFRAPKFFALTFKIYHYAGEVDYTTTEWIDKNRDPLETDLKDLMLKSSYRFIRDLFDEKLVSLNLPPATPTQPSSRGSSAQRRRPAGAAFTYVSRQYKEQLNHLMSVLHSTSPHFIRCIIPNLQKRQNLINDKLVLDQLKCNGVLEGIRIARKGWPNRIKYPEFIRRYYLLKPGLDPKTPQPKEATKEMCAYLAKTYPDKIFADQMRMGLSKVFFRSGQLAAFENIREQIISGMVVSIQAASRAYLSRRDYNKMREQEIAAKTIQRNVRGYIELIDSLWYKLFIAGKPLINRRDFLKEIELLSKQLAALQKQLASLTEEIARLKKERAEADSNLARVEKDFDDTKAKHTALETEISALKKEKDSLSEKLNLSEDSLKDEGSRGNALGREKTELEKIRTELEHNLNDERERNKALEEAKRKAEADRDDWEDKLDLAQSRVSDHQKKIAELQKQFDEQEGRAHDMDQLATQLNGKLNGLIKSLATAEEDFARENSDKSGLDNTRKDLQTQVETLKANLEEIREKVNASNAQAKRLDAQLAETNSQLEEQKAKLNKSEKAGKEFRSKAKDLADALEEETVARANAEKAKSAMDARFNELTSQVRSLESAKSVSADQTKALKNQLDDLTKRVEDGEAANNRLKNENKAAQEEEADLNDRLEQEREGAKKEKKRLTQKIQELTNAIENAPKGDAKSEDLRKMEDQIREIEDQTKAAEDAKVKADAANVEYAASLKDLKAKLAEVEKKAAEGSEANRKAKEALDQLTRELEKEEDARALLEAKNRHAAAEVEDLKRKISAFAGDAGRTSELTAHYKGENVGLKSDYDELDADNKILGKEVKEMRSKFDEVMKQAGAEKGQKQRLQNSNGVLKKLVMDRILANNEILTQLRTHQAHFSGEGQ